MGKKLTLNVEGTEFTKKDLKDRFEKYNELYFYGRLGKCKFHWMSPNGGDYGEYTVQYNKSGIVSSIGVARNTVWTEENLMEILVHEMIHMYIRTVEGKKFDGILGHGVRFRSHCKRLKKDYGLCVRIHPTFGYINKKLSPKLLGRVILWLFDW